jgi:shikimate kinase
MNLKLKRTPGIYLVGFMGCGKTTIGRILADRLGWTFIDLDKDIEAQLKTTIARIFETQGEDEFRRLESEAIRGKVRSIERGAPMVVALGGGAFVKPENVELLKNNGVTIWLDCPLSVVKRRVEQNSDRPLARDSRKFEQLYQERQRAYGEADYRVESADDDPLTAVEIILKLPLF